MRERILLRHIGQQALEAIDNDDFTETEWRDFLMELVLDIALMLAEEEVTSFDDAREVVS